MPTAKLSDLLRRFRACISILKTEKFCFPFADPLSSDSTRRNFKPFFNLSRDHFQTHIFIRVCVFPISSRIVFHKGVSERVFPKLRNPADLSSEKSSAFPMTDSFTLCRYPIGPFDQHKSLCSVLHIVSGSVQIQTSFTFENPVSFCLIIRTYLLSHVCSDRLFVYISQIRPSLSALLLNFAAIGSYSFFCSFR